MPFIVVLLVVVVLSSCCGYVVIWKGYEESTSDSVIVVGYVVAI